MGETLRAFTERFSKISLSIKNLMPKIAMHHLISTLRPGQFTDSLIKKPTKNLDELQNRATKFMQIKELRDFHKNAWADNGGDKGKEKGWGIRYIPDRSEKFRDNQGP